MGNAVQLARTERSNAQRGSPSNAPAVQRHTVGITHSGEGHVRVYAPRTRKQVRPRFTVPTNERTSLRPFTERLG
jgi:hypothetical protein